MKRRRKYSIVVIIALVVCSSTAITHLLAQTGGGEYPLRKVRLALEAYRIDHGSYPAWEYKNYGKGKRIATFKTTSLTTPVGYVPRMPVDIFSHDENHWYSYYSIIPEKKEGAHGWILVCAGPDRDYDIDASKVYDIASTATRTILITHHYDATNGALSSGDLITSSKWKL